MAAFVDELKQMIDRRRSFGGHPLWLRIAEGGVRPDDLRLFAAQFFLLWLFNKVGWFTNYSASGVISAPPRTVGGFQVTGSGAEHFARVLQRHEKACVIGERTVGAEAAVAEVEGPDGSVLKFGAFRITDRTGRGLQDEGVVPDISVRMTLEDVERLGPVLAFRDWEQRLLRAVQDRLRRTAQ